MGVLSNAEWQRHIERSLRALGRKVAASESQEEPVNICRCGCGTLLSAGRKFVNHSHQVQWMKSGGGRELSDRLWHADDDEPPAAL